MRYTYNINYSELNLKSDLEDLDWRVSIKESNIKTLNEIDLELLKSRRAIRSLRYKIQDEIEAIKSDFYAEFDN